MSSAPERPANPNAPRLFMQKFLRYGTRVASVYPSTPALASELCRRIDPARPQTILELGAGTGAVTAVAVAKMHPESTLLAVELDADFAQVVRQRFPHIQVIQGDAAAAETALHKLGVTQVDLVISGLPTPSLPRSVTQAVLESYHRLAPSGSFSQLTVMPWVYQRFYRRLFHEVEFCPVWRSVPPGGAYHCRGLRTDFATHLPH